MTYFSGKVAVVTGAASGIGRALAVELARRGARLAICDIDVAGLAETESLVRAVGAEVRAEVLDVSQRERVVAYADTVAEQLGVVHLVFNNAGIAFTGTVEQMSFKDIDRVMDVDFWGVVNGTKAFLPHLVASGDGHVVNVSSVFGLFSVPSQSAYNAAKFAVRGFTEALRQEMINGNRPVKVTCVHPGGIRTNIARNGGEVEGVDHEHVASSFDRLARTSPAKAADIILAGVEKDKARVLVGPDAWVLDAFVRLTGSGYQRVVRAVSRRSGL
ncbi:SDR family NAD(P)-dependent oxidoreductase [Aeromicrobium sp. SMF47]|uniref:SDR family NAD(P)-dependent oxidoreductase n=1 Tax=Aeromicrobium TaxID=2040 RepID=UPI00129ED251|nr:MULTISPECIES: SDR family NAD(P)-dependent oxidoreductase [Aeromicrobium]MRJ76546.1 SDR family NAD(P)-dependent oxidoreductase [Aeromicrobium yanjiei]MRK00896.1 SDR family NAD(P)-dependent oxidoreductase [Aeromicrobium sp. S22]